jgi:hypothetical protein
MSRMSEDQRQGAREPNWQPIGMLPVVKDMVCRELTQINELVRDLPEARSTPIDQSLLDQLTQKFDDNGAWHRLMTQQLARWLHDHPDTVGLDEFADLVADLEPSRQRLLGLVTRHRQQR